MQRKPNIPLLACLVNALKILGMMHVCSVSTALANTDKPPAIQSKSVAQQARERMSPSNGPLTESLLVQHLHTQPDAADAAECTLLSGQMQLKNQRPDDALRSFSHITSHHPKTHWADGSYFKR